MGRLALRQGDASKASVFLTKAIDLQTRIDDAMGLARSVAARAEQLAAQGEADEAVEHLLRSIELNRSKGSPLGLAYNRRVLESVSGRVTPAARVRLARARQTLEHAEEVLGRAPLPPMLH